VVIADEEERTSFQTCYEGEGVDRIELRGGAYRVAAQYD
jgi:hypothetical protein